MATKEDFESLVEEFSGFVLSIGLRILGNYQKAQDVHQEVFLSIWKRWKKFDKNVNWPGYLYRTAVRKAMDIAKKKTALPIEDYIEQGFADSSEPQQRIEAVELKQKLIGSIVDLPQRQADVFILARIQGKDSTEIAEILGCSARTVRVHLHRAVKKLASEYEDYSKK